jgi:hypothetical protein
MVVRFEPVIKPDGYPDLQWRKQLAARLLIARNISPRANRLKGAILTAASAAAKQPGQVPKLDNFLGLVLKAARHQAKNPAANVDTAKKKLHDRTFKDFRDDLTSISCRDCVRSRLTALKEEFTEPVLERRICDGKNDHDNLTGAASCLALITQLFFDLAALAEKHYASLLEHSNNHKLLIYLQIVPTNEPDLGAKTEFLDEDGNRIAKVQLKVPVEHLHHTQYFRIPYYIFHEICVHGPEAWDLEGPRRLCTPSRCPLREGFVDAAAVYVLNKALSAGEIARGGNFRFKDDFQFAAEHSQLDRAVLPLGEEISEEERLQAKQDIVRARKDGLMLFRKLVSERDGDQIARLAFSLNLLCLDEDSRALLVDHLDSALQAHPMLGGYARPEGGTPAWLGQLCAAATAGKMKDLDVLVNQLLGNRPAEF